jgi:hypothetical protein
MPLARAPHDANRLFEDQRRAEREEQTVLGLLAVGSAHQALEADPDHSDHERREHSASP